MRRYKNPKVVFDRVDYEIVWITEFAQHIAKRHFNQADSARHLDFMQIQDILLNPDDRIKMENNLWRFVKMLSDGKQYMVIAEIGHKRCLPKSGRIDNYQNN